jgi:hypothetical protein
MRVLGVGSVVAAAGLRPHALLAAPSNSEAPPIARAPAGHPLVHRTGLVLAPQPSAFNVSETPAGYRIEPVDARRMRSPWSIQVGLSDVQPAASVAGQRRKVGEREAHYRVTVLGDSGSGGPLHTLTAWLPCKDRGIVMTASQQVEPPAKPDWSTAWAVLASSQCGPTR